MVHEILNWRVGVLALALALALPCLALDIPPDVSVELADARAAWRKAEENNKEIRAARPGDETALDAIIDARDAAYDQAILNFEKALAKDPTHPQVLSEFGRYWLSRRDFFIARRYLEDAWASRFERPLKLTPAERDFADLLMTTRMKEFAASVREPGATPALGGPRAEVALPAADKADILRALGGIAERAGEMGPALEYYREAVKRFPADPRNTVSLAVGLCAAGKPNEAMRLLNAWDRVVAAGAEAPVDYPKDRPDILGLGLYTLALAREEMGHIEDALAIYRRAVDACKQGQVSSGETAESARMAIARLEDKLDEFAENEKATALQLKEVEKINAERQKVIDKLKAMNQPYNALKMLPLPETDRQAFSEALNLCVLGLEKKQRAFSDPEFVAAVSKLRDNKIKAKEVENTAEFGSFQIAANSFQSAVARYSRFSRPYYELALCELQMHRYTTSRHLLDAAALYNPNDVATLSLRGSVLLELGQWKEAAEVFRKITTLDGDNGAAHFGLGRALTALKASEAMCAEALDAFSRAMRLGVRDERMETSRALTAKDGQIYAGQIVEDDNDWIVMEESAAPFRIAKHDVLRVYTGAGLREQALDLLERYRRGEKPPNVQRVVGRRHPEDDPETFIRPPGAIFGQ